MMCITSGFGNQKGKKVPILPNNNNLTKQSSLNGQWTSLNNKYSDFTYLPIELQIIRFLSLKLKG